MSRNSLISDKLLADGLSDLMGYLPKTTSPRDKMMIENAYYWGAYVFTSILQSMSEARLNYLQAGEILENINQEIDAYRERADRIVSKRDNVSMH